MSKASTEMVHIPPETILEMISDLQKYNVNLKQIAKFIGLTSGGFYYSRTKGNFSINSWKEFKKLYEKTTLKKSRVDESNFSSAASRAKIQQSLRSQKLKKSIDFSNLTDDDILKEIRNRPELILLFLKEIRTDLLVQEVDHRKKMLTELKL